MTDLLCTSIFVFLTRLVTESEDTFIRRVTGVEAMRFIGWDLAHWRDGEWPSTSTDTLCMMAGNAWSSWHFIPFWTSIMCGLPWESILRANKALKEEMAKGSEDSEDSYSEVLGSDVEAEGE